MEDCYRKSVEMGNREDMDISIQLKGLILSKISREFER